MILKTMADVKRLNTQTGHHFFEPATMRFFNSKIESELYQGLYFITSERRLPTMPKLYTIRVAHADGSIDRLGEFQAYKSLQSAKEVIKDTIRVSKLITKTMD